VSGEYGEYLTTVRTTCHGADMAGGQFDPGFMPQEACARIDDDELKGSWRYLQSLDGGSP